MAKKSGVPHIHIKPSKQGSLHHAMGVPMNHKITVGRLEADKRHAEATGNTARVKKDTFAINARKWHH